MFVTLKKKGLPIKMQKAFSSPRSRMFILREGEKTTKKAIKPFVQQKKLFF